MLQKIIIMSVSFLTSLDFYYYYYHYYFGMEVRESVWCDLFSFEMFTGSVARTGDGKQQAGERFEKLKPIFSSIEVVLYLSLAA